VRLAEGHGAGLEAPRGGDEAASRGRAPERQGGRHPGAGAVPREAGFGREVAGGRRGVCHHFRDVQAAGGGTRL